MVTYHESVQSLIVLSQTEGPIELAGLLIDMHFRNLRTKGLLTSHNEETSRRLEVTDRLYVCLSVLVQLCSLVASSQEMKGKSGREDNYHVEEFYVPQDLFGLVIGIKGQNLQMTRKIEGVVHIILDDDHSKVRVVAEVCAGGPGLPCMVCCEVTVLCCLQTAQAAAKARDMLEYGSEEVRIPRDLAGIGGVGGCMRCLCMWCTHVCMCPCGA